MSNTQEDLEYNEQTRPITFFEIWGPWRESVIEQHRFYVDQGKNKLLAQFNNCDVVMATVLVCVRWSNRRPPY